MHAKWQMKHVEESLNRTFIKKRSTSRRRRRLQRTLSGEILWIQNGEKEGVESERGMRRFE